MTAVMETTIYTRADDIGIAPAVGPKWEVVDEKTEGVGLVLDWLLAGHLHRGPKETSGSPFGHIIDLAVWGEATADSISAWVEGAAQMNQDYFAPVYEMKFGQSFHLALVEPIRFVARIPSPLARHKGARYRAVLEEDEDGGFVAIIPALRGCIAEGENIAETLEHLKDALQGWMDVADKRGLDIPSPSQVRP